MQRRARSRGMLIPLIVLTVAILLSRVGRQALPRHGYDHPSAPQTTQNEAPFKGRVVSISDGDSITVTHSGREEVIRLFGVDSPEHGQAFSRAAREFTSRMVFGKTVSVDVETHDRYGRSVAWVTMPDGRSLNEELVRSGYAWWYCHYDPNNPRLAELEQEARAARRGLWADKHPTPPWKFRENERD